MLNNMNGQFGQQSNRFNYNARQPSNSGIGYNPNQSMGGSGSGIGMNNPMPQLPSPKINYPEFGKTPMQGGNLGGILGQGNIGGGLTQGDIGLGLTGGNQDWNQANPYMSSGPEFGGGDMNSLMNQIRLMYPGAFSG